MNLRELIEKRANLFEQMKELNERSLKNDDGMTAEEEKQWERMNKDYDAMTEKIKKAERMQKIEDTAGDTNEDKVADREDQTRASEEYSNAFWRVFSRPRGSAVDPDDYRSLKVADDTKGGYLVPDEYERQIIRELYDVNIMRNLATVVTSGSDRKIPMQKSKPTFARIPEEGTYTKTDMTFGLISLSAYKMGGIILVSEELLFDSAFDLPGYIRTEASEAGGESEEADFVSGDGVGKPRGVVLDAETGVTTAATDAVTADELIEHYHELGRRYRQRASWLMHDNTALAIRKLKDGNGQYIWQPGLQAGQPDRLLNRPVNISDDMDELGSSNKPIAFGDYSYYRIMDRVGLSIQRLDELYAESGQVGFKVFWRNDGRLLLDKAVQVMENA